MKPNPESAPPLPPNSSDLSPPNRLGLYPNQQFSSGLATELPPLYFRSNVDDLSKIDSNSDPNQYRARDEGLPKTNLVASTLSLPYAMYASDTQSIAKKLTKLLPSHPHSENIDYMPSVGSTEKTYLKRINAINQSYVIPLRQLSKSSSTRIINKYEATLMFGKIEYIVKANQSLLPVLKHV
ncbi:hypothetical protein PPACK8108_LOCUS26391 [Phakopsora pachyrhizi]|uniref:Uncharacterized protein n=1 Tax=Phakopsora pachyrhizi TaxID=170000 RepID=A0AAV0BTR2_PHAPC|nr:hypothetical protein PPACK8108_LOCUS26391 [Phakopsora pachyrhizi]